MADSVPKDPKKVLGSDEQTQEAVRVSNEGAIADNQKPTDEAAAEAVRRSNDEQYDAEHEGREH